MTIRLPEYELLEGEAESAFEVAQFLKVAYLMDTGPSSQEIDAYAVEWDRMALREGGQ